MKKKKQIKVKETEIILKDTVTKKFSILKGKSKLSWDFWKTWYVDKYMAGKAVIINMELINGLHRTFIVTEKDAGFVFRSKKYIFDDDSKYYNIDIKLYVFDYHENMALPIKRIIPMSDIKKTIESSGVTDIEYAINPSTLQRFMTAKIAEGVMKGTQLDEFLRKLNMFVIIILVIALVHLALFLQASGLLKQINLPFL